MQEFETVEINLNDKEQKKAVQEFLLSNGLFLEEDVEYTLALMDHSKIIGTFSLSGKVMKCFAIDKEYRGGGTSSVLFTSLTNHMYSKGIYHSFIFTKPEVVPVFISFGCKIILKTEEAALLEYGIYDINQSIKKMMSENKISKGINKACMVMNCNPFTKGHLYLIQEAAKREEEVLVFIVEEDKSIFPFKVRINLVREGTKNLPNVKVIPAGEYIISQATFPSYFLKNEDLRLKCFREIDAGIFGKYFCKEMNIVRRYVGSEPYDKFTEKYNRSLENILPSYGVNIIEIERSKYNGKEISASIVKKMVLCDKMDSIRDFVPEVTYGFLITDEGKEILEKIKKNPPI